jgi:hypothetical protein
MKLSSLRNLVALALISAPAIAFAHPVVTSRPSHDQTVHSRAPQVHVRDIAANRHIR